MRTEKQGSNDNKPEEAGEGDGDEVKARKTLRVKAEAKEKGKQITQA